LFKLGNYGSRLVSFFTLRSIGHAMILLICFQVQISPPLVLPLTFVYVAQIYAVIATVYE